AASWFADGVEAGRIAVADTELLDLGARRWFWVPSGEALPGLDGPSFCRTFLPAAEGGPA
ncbi:MAG: hypothetical protein LC750_06120, partial [Actinobacteria bacterium]|nr:hypothetical protein [Actinomycetota bacterium]